MKNYYQPKPSKIVQRFKFNTRNQAEGESIATYLAALRTLAEHCEYRDSLKDMLRDRLVCGVLHEGTQKRLLYEKDLTYQKAVELAQSIELAEKDMKDIKHSTSTTRTDRYSPEGIEHTTTSSTSFCMTKASSRLFFSRSLTFTFKRGEVW